MFFQESCPPGIIFPGLWIIMNFSVQFDNQFFFYTVKVDNEWADTMLTAKLSSVKFFALELRP